jgi:large subunit ribosomal protein L10
MTREEKAVIIDELSQKFSNTPYFYITSAAGMTVSEVNVLRSLCFERGIEYRVVKNTLIRKALETLDTDYSSFDTVLKGFSGVMFHPESGKVPAQLIKEFKKKAGSDKLKFKGASVDSSVFVGENKRWLERLSVCCNLLPKMLSRLFRAVATNWLVFLRLYLRKKTNLLNICPVELSGSELILSSKIHLFV